MAWMSGLSQPIPLDPSVHTGKLANGFTYYIRHNEEPAKRVQFYLVCNVGSVLEDDDQQGLAHFMEHMNFNGTRHFPKNELVDYLQKAGVQFGADLNAHTGFDETVYQLPLPTEDTSLVNNGLQIMRDWAQEATLDPVELDKERGVVLEEERLGKGAKDRMSRQYLPMMVNDSKYAYRLPIGKDSILLHFTPAVIRRFHHDWYRPDLQALIVVGDIDVAAIEKEVRQLFSDLKNPEAERRRIAYTVPLNDHPQFMAVTDKEVSSTELDIYIKHKSTVLRTEADYLEGIEHTLFNSLVAARRVAELSADPDPAYISSGASIQSFAGGTDFFAFEVEAKDGQLEKAFRQTWTVIEKIRRDGFTPAELDRAKQNYLRSMEESVKEKSKTSSVSLVGEYQRLFLDGEASPGIDWEYNFARTHVGAITPDDIKKVTADYLENPNPDVLVMSPEKDRGQLPDLVRVTNWMNGLHSAALTAYKDAAAPQGLLSSRPRSGKITNSKTIAPIDVAELTLSNGVKVVLKPTAFKNDEITFKAFAPGGTSVFGDSDYDAAAAAAPMIQSFGLGGLNPVQLNNALNGKAVKVAPYIGNRSQGVTGTSSVADFETALQLVYLYFTAPRKDSVLYNNIIGRSRSVLPNRYADPANVFSDSMAYVMGNYSYRNSPPAVGKLDRIGLQKVYDAYRQLFSDAGAFTFVFVGNFNKDSIRPLLEKYLGSLPATCKNKPARDLGIHIPGGRLVKTVYKGKEDKAVVRLVYSGDYEYSPDNNQYIHALGQILQIKLLQHLREEESEVYSPSVQTIYNKYPSNRYALVVAFGCAPKNVDHLAAMVEDELKSLREKGPDPEDIGKYKAAYGKNMELALRDNGFWLDYLAGHYENQEQVLDILDMTQRLDILTPASLQAAAGRYLNGKNLIRFTLLPEK